VLVRPAAPESLFPAQGNLRGKEETHQWRGAGDCAGLGGPGHFRPASASSSAAFIAVLPPASGADGRNSWQAGKGAVSDTVIREKPRHGAQALRGRREPYPAEYWQMKLPARTPQYRRTANRNGARAAASVSPAGTASSGKGASLGKR